MIKHCSALFFLNIIAIVVLTLASCKNDDEPAGKPVVSFEASAMTISEGGGTINVGLQLDKPAPRDLTLKYELTGTALAGTIATADYNALGVAGEVQIQKGATEASIQLQIKQDLVVEGNETIIVTITAIVDALAEIGSTKTITLTLEDDDLGSKVSFSSSTRSVKESDGVIEIELVLDKPAAQNITVDYGFNYPSEGAIAWDSLYAFNRGIRKKFYDFYVDGAYGKVSFAAGEASAKIRIQLLSDFIFEGDELMEITISAVSIGGQIGEVNKTTVTVKQEDGRAIALLWEPTYTNVDMDIFLWVGETTGTLESVLATATREAVTPQEEIIFIPSSFSDLITGELAFGLSYVYYSGTVEPMNFEVQFVDFAAGTPEAESDREVFEGTYLLANINKWDSEESGDVPIVVQTFRIVNGEHTDLSGITLPSSGSRMRTFPLPRNINKDKSNTSLDYFRR